MNIFEVAINAARSKVSPFFVKIKMWTKPSYVKNKFILVTACTGEGSDIGKIRLHRICR